MEKVTNTFIFATTFTLILSILLVLLFIISRRWQLKQLLKHKKQLLEQEYKIKEEALLQLSRDLHDDIGSSLSGINILNQLAEEQIKQQAVENTHELLQRMRTYTNEVIEKVSDMAWLMKPNRDSLSILIQKLKAYSIAATSTKNIGLHFESLPDITGKELSLQQRKAVYLISKEAINNIVKYAACRNIYYAITVADNSMHVSIKDDGKGFLPAESNNGNGLANMKARAAEIEGELRIDSIPDGGTTIELNLQFPPNEGN